jgi:hypothetical protein
MKTVLGRIRDLVLVPVGFLLLFADSSSANSLVVTSWEAISNRAGDRCARVSVRYQAPVGHSTLIDNDDIIALMENGNAYRATDGAFDGVRASNGDEFTGVVCFGRHQWPIRQIQIRQ